MTSRVQIYAGRLAVDVTPIDAAGKPGPTVRIEAGKHGEAQLHANQDLRLHEVPAGELINDWDKPGEGENATGENAGGAGEQIPGDPAAPSDPAPNPTDGSAGQAEQDIEDYKRTGRTGRRAPAGEARP